MTGVGDGEASAVAAAPFGLVRLGGGVKFAGEVVAQGDFAGGVGEELGGKLGDRVFHHDAAVAGGGEGIALDAIEDEGEIGKVMTAFEIVVCLIAGSVEALEDWGEAWHSVCGTDFVGQILCDNLGNQGGCHCSWFSVVEASNVGSYF